MWTPMGSQRWAPAAPHKIVSFMPSKARWRAMKRQCCRGCNCNDSCLVDIYIKLYGETKDGNIGRDKVS